jgi:multidrug efflux pump subunit AcrA (membrane-fusion protein)
MALCLLSACQQQHPTKTLKTQVVHYTSLNKTLHFTGTVQPIHESSLVSPVDGTIDAVHYHYGQWVSKNMAVFTLNSADLQKRYNDTVTEYLKPKTVTPWQRPSSLGQKIYGNLAYYLKITI